MSDDQVQALDRAIRELVKAESGDEQTVTDWVVCYGAAARSASEPNGIAELSGFIIHDDTMPYAALGLAARTAAKLSQPQAWGGA